MHQKNTIVFPEFSYEVIMDILEKFDLRKKHQQISDEMFSLPQGDSKFNILLENLPGRFLFTISRNYLNKKIGKDSLPEMISEKLGLGIEKSKELLEDLEKRILSQVKIIEEESEGEELRKIDLTREQVPSQNIKEKKEDLASPKTDDPYREKID